MRSLDFARQFLRHPRQLGTLVESSRVLAEAMAEETEGSSCVVEFGAGTGPVTREILKRLPEKGRLLCLEINPEFCRCLERIGDPRLQVVNDDARNLGRYVDRPDCIVSGLPLALFGREMTREILAICTGCRTYVQLQYTPVVGREIRRYFPDIRWKFVLRNFPPALVYVCRGADGQSR